MEIINSDDYEDMATVYQCIEIDRLNQVLKQHGIADVEVRKAICSSYFFQSSDFVDMGCFQVGGKTLWPEITFAERALDPKAGLGEIEKLHLCSDYFAFHEYAHGDIYSYFDEHHEDLSKIETEAA